MFPNRGVLGIMFFFIKGEEAGKTICVLGIPLTNASLEVLSHVLNYRVWSTGGGGGRGAQTKHDSIFRVHYGNMRISTLKIGRYHPFMMQGLSNVSWF